MPPIALSRPGAQLIDMLSGLLPCVGVTGAAVALQAPEERLFAAPGWHPEPAAPDAADPSP